MSEPVPLLIDSYGSIRDFDLSQKNLTAQPSLHNSCGRSVRLSRFCAITPDEGQEAICSPAHIGTYGAGHRANNSRSWSRYCP